MLVAKQAKLDATLPDLSSALHLAVHSGSVPIVQTLLEKGLDPNITGHEAQTPLHLAAQCNMAPLVDLLLRAGAQVIVSQLVITVYFADFCLCLRRLKVLCLLFR